MHFVGLFLSSLLLCIFMYFNIEISILRLIYCWMWSKCVGFCQLLNWKMHGETLKLRTLYFNFLLGLSGRYARVVDHLAVRSIAQGAPLGGGSTLHPKKKGSCRILFVRWAWLFGNTSSPHWNPSRPLLHAVQPPRNHGQKPSRTMYRVI